MSSSVGARLLADGEEDHDPRREALADDHRRGVTNGRVLQQGGLDLAELDAVAAHLHHVVAPAEEGELPAGADPHDVAGGVGGAWPRGCPQYPEKTVGPSTMSSPSSPDFASAPSAVVAQTRSPLTARPMGMLVQPASRGRATS